MDFIRIDSKDANIQHVFDNFFPFGFQTCLAPESIIRNSHDWGAKQFILCIPYYAVFVRILFKLGLGRVNTKMSGPQAKCRELQKMAL